MIETYLVGRGWDLTVSVALKMYISPLTREEASSEQSEMNVYTAFRDTKTYEARERVENPKRLYSVGENSDFAYCLEGHSYYLFNRGDEKPRYDYRNENNLGGGFYNAGATAIVASEGSDLTGPSLIYGFLACDVLNTNYDNDVIDKNVAYILMFIASMIAYFCDHVNYVWAMSGGYDDGKGEILLDFWRLTAIKNGHLNSENELALSGDTNGKL